jgi:hypothetical protein
LHLRREARKNEMQMPGAFQILRAARKATVVGQEYFRRLVAE